MRSLPHRLLHLILLVSLIFPLAAAPPAPVAVAAGASPAPLRDGPYTKIGAIDTDNGSDSGDGKCDILWIEPTTIYEPVLQTVRDFTNQITYDSYYWRNAEGAQIKFYRNLNAANEYVVQVAGSTVGGNFGVANEDINDLFENGASESDINADYNRMVKIALLGAAQRLPAAGAGGKKIWFTGHSQGGNVAQLVMLEMMLNSASSRVAFPSILDVPDERRGLNFPTEMRNTAFGTAMQNANMVVKGGIIIASRPHWMLAAINKITNQIFTTFVSEWSDPVPTLYSPGTKTSGSLFADEVSDQTALLNMPGTQNSTIGVPSTTERRSQIYFDDGKRSGTDAHGQSYIDPSVGRDPDDHLYHGSYPALAPINTYLPGMTTLVTGSLNLKYIGGVGFDCRSSKVYEEERQRTNPDSERPEWHKKNCILNPAGGSSTPPPPMDPDATAENVAYQANPRGDTRKPDGIPDTLWVDPTIQVEDGGGDNTGRSKDPDFKWKQFAIVEIWTDQMNATPFRNPFALMRERPLEKYDRQMADFANHGLFTSPMYGIALNREFIINRVTYVDANGNPTGETATEPINPEQDCANGGRPAGIPGGPSNGGPRNNGGPRSNGERRFPNGSPDDYVAPRTFPDSAQANAYLESLVADATLESGSPAWTQQVMSALEPRIRLAAAGTTPAALAYFRYVAAMLTYRHTLPPLLGLLEDPATNQRYQAATGQLVDVDIAQEIEILQGLRDGIPTPEAAIRAYWQGVIDNDPAITAWRTSAPGQQLEAIQAPLLNARTAYEALLKPLGEQGRRTRINSEVLQIERLLTATPGVGILNAGLSDWAASTLSFVGVPAKLVDPQTTAPLRAPHTLIVPSSALNAYRQDLSITAWLETFTRSGGTLIVLAQAYGDDWALLPGGAVRGLGFEEDILCREESVNVLGRSPLLAGINRDRPDLQLDGSFTSYPANATVLLNRRTGNQMPAMIEYPFGAGRVVAMSLYPDFAVINGMQTKDDLPFARSLFLATWAEATSTAIDGSAAPGQPISLELALDNPGSAPLTSISVVSDVAAGATGDTWRYQAHYNDWRQFPELAAQTVNVPLDPPLAPGAERNVPITLPASQSPGLHRLGINGQPAGLYQVDSPFSYASLAALTVNRDADTYWVGDTATISVTITPTPNLTSALVVRLSESSARVPDQAFALQPNQPLSVTLRLPVTAALLNTPLRLKLTENATSRVLAHAAVVLPPGLPPVLAVSSTLPPTATTLPFTVTNIGVGGTTYSGTIRLVDTDHGNTLLASRVVAGTLGHTQRRNLPVAARWDIPLPGNQAAGAYRLIYRLVDQYGKTWAGSVPVTVPGIAADLVSVTDQDQYDPTQIVSITTSITPDGDLAGSWLRVQIKKPLTADRLTLLAGTTNVSDGIGSRAHLSSGRSIALSHDGSFAIVADTGNNLLRQLDLRTGELTTIAGIYRSARYISNVANTPDGFATEIDFINLKDVAISPDDQFVYVLDQNRIRRLDLTTRQVTTLAGNNRCFSGCGVTRPASQVGNPDVPAISTYQLNNDGIGSNARFTYPNSLALSPDGTFALITDLFTLRRLDFATNAVSTLAGSNTSMGSVDGIGAAARFSDLRGIAITPDQSAALMVDRDTIRRIDLSTAAVATVAGNPYDNGTSDGIGSAARFYDLREIAIDSSATFALMAGNTRLRRLDLTTSAYTVTTPLNPAFAPGGVAALALPSAGSQALVVANNRIHTLDLTTYATSPLVGETTSSSCYNTTCPTVTRNGPALDARFGYTATAAATPDGRQVLVYSDYTIKRFDRDTGQVEVLAGNGTRQCPKVDGIGSAARMCEETGAIVVDPTGSFALFFDQRSYLRRLDLTTLAVTTVAGQAPRYCYSTTIVDGVGSAAIFCDDDTLAISHDGSFALSIGGSIIRRIDLATWGVTTIAGQLAYSSVLDGVGAAARIKYAGAINIAPDDGSAMFMDENTIRRIDLGSRAVTTLLNTCYRPKNSICAYSASLIVDPAMQFALIQPWLSQQMYRYDLTTKALEPIYNDGLLYSQYSADGMFIQPWIDPTPLLLTHSNYGAGIQALSVNGVIREEFVPISGTAPQTLTLALTDPSLMADVAARGPLELHTTLFGPQRTAALTPDRQILAEASYPFFIASDSYTVTLDTTAATIRLGDQVSLVGQVRNVSAQTGVTLAISDNGVALPPIVLPDLVPGASARFTRQLQPSVGFHSYVVSTPTGEQASAMARVMTPTVQLQVFDSARTAVLGIPFTATVALSNTSRVRAAVRLQLGAGPPVDRVLAPSAALTETLSIAVPETLVGDWSPTLVASGDLTFQQTFPRVIQVPGPAKVTLLNAGIGIDANTATMSASTARQTAIPDNTEAGVLIPLDVATFGPITDINVRVNITHSQISDLQIDLISPQGTEVRLLDRDPYGANLWGTTFDDQAYNSIGNGNPPYSGTYRSYNSLNRFNGQLLEGVWQLRVRDRSPDGGVGQVDSWGLTVEYRAFQPVTAVQPNQVVRLLAMLQPTQRGQQLVTLTAFEQTATIPVNVRTLEPIAVSTMLRIPETVPGGTYAAGVTLDGVSVSFPVVVTSWKAELDLAVPLAAVEAGARFTPTITLTETAGIGGPALLTLRYNSAEYTRTVTLAPSTTQQVGFPLVASTNARRVTVALSALPTSDADAPRYAPIIDSKPLNVLRPGAMVELDTLQVSAGMTLSGALVINRPISAALLLRPTALGGDLIWSARLITPTGAISTSAIDLNQTPTGRWPFAIPIPASQPRGRYAFDLVVDGVWQPVLVDINGPQVTVHRADLVSSAAATVTLTLDVESYTAVVVTPTLRFQGGLVPLVGAPTLTLAPGRQPVQLSAVLPAWMTGRGLLDLAFVTADGTVIGGSSSMLQRGAASLVQAQLRGSSRSAPLDVIVDVVGSGPATLEVASAGGVTSAQSLTLDGYRTLTVPLTLAPGATTVAITLTDESGVADTRMLSVAASLPDTLAPTVTLTPPDPATYATATTAAVLVGGTVSDDSAVATVEVNGRRAELDRTTGAYSLTLYLAPGSHSVQTLARDGSGNQAESGAHTVVVTYQEPLVALAQSTLVASESSAPLTVTIQLSEPAALTATVRIRSIDGSALAGEDYGAVDQLVTFAPYQTTATLTLELLDDQVAEADESLRLVLEQVSGATLTPPTTLSITINDDDGVPLQRIYLPLALRN